MPRSSAEAVYVISVAAELAGMHPQTLREYERKGLVTPRRTKGNTRRYSERDIERLREVQQLTRDHGLNLAGAALVLELRLQLIEAFDRIDELEQRLAKLQAEARARVNEVHRTYRRDLVPYQAPAKPVPRS